MAVFRLRGSVQHYAWGGTQFLPSLLQLDNPKEKPWAEYWLGVHPKSPSYVQLEEEQALDAFLLTHPEYLGQEVQENFGGLPFLFKVLDVQRMLSIQLHPTRERARQGFAREETLGIPRLAPNRNYKDQNHKPEVMVALTDFWLLHGFRSEAAIRQTLCEVSGWQELLPVLDDEGVFALYRQVMKADQEKINRWLQPLYLELEKRQADLRKDEPDYWAWQAFQTYTDDGDFDRGVFSIYWFNLVYLRPGQGIFQGAGIPHAYLQGANIELMANSDNVLRGGLTPKHIDVPELLANVTSDTVVPEIMEGVMAGPGIINYPVPVPDFSLQKIEVKTNQELQISHSNVAICILTQGALIVDGQHCVKGDSFMITAGTSVEVVSDSTGSAVLFCATI